MEAAMKGQKRYLSCCYLRFCAYSATITYMKQPMVSLRFTLGYALLLLQRDNYSFALRPLPFALRPQLQS